MSGTLICGKTTGNAVVPVQVNADGTLEMTAEIDSSALAKETTLESLRTENATNLGTIDSSLSDGTAVSRIMGSEDPNDVAGTQKQIHVDGNGNVQTEVVNTINVAPANTLNSGITNDPANSVAVGLRARQTITDASTETFLKCDASGVLEVSSSGGGSGNANTYPTLNSITTATNFAGGMVQSNYVELTNAKNVVINCIHTGDATARSNFANDVALSVEFTDDDTSTVCYSGASTPVFGLGTIQADGSTTGSAVAVISVGENSEAVGQITGKFCRVVAINNNNSLSNTAFAIDFKVVVSGI
jgi:hypothetical protein